SVWRVHEGEMLRAVLARWGARAGAEVLFLTDRRYRLDGDAAFEGGFADAAQALFRSLSHLPHAPVAARSEGGTTLVVRHRMPASSAKGDKP
ncbi:MAG: TcpQ domain-containing protein, partial [Alphaproteobacteria bacterium]|nr:TcpQ domain-containing protein [Alphaproteobacteria bacterium]